MRARQRALIWGIPLLLIYAAAQIVPFAISVWDSLLNNMFERRFIGLENYREMLHNQYFVLAMRNTAVFTIPAVLAVTFIALLLAALFRSIEGSGGNMRVAFVLPMLLPSAAVTLVFHILFAGEKVEAILGEDVAKTIPVFFLYVWKNTGMLFLIFYSAMRMVPRERYEAAALDGANAWQQFWAITLPSISSALLFSCTYALMQAFRVYKEAYLLYGAYPGGNLYMLQHYMNNHFVKLNFQKVAATGVAFTLLCLLLSSAAIRAEDQILR